MAGYPPLQQGVASPGRAIAVRLGWQTIRTHEISGLDVLSAENGEPVMYADSIAAGHYCALLVEFVKSVVSNH